MEIGGQKPTKHYFIDRDRESILVYLNGAYYACILCNDEQQAVLTEKGLRQTLLDEEPCIDLLQDNFIITGDCPEVASKCFDCNLSAEECEGTKKCRRF